MKTFNDLKVGDPLYYGRYQKDKFVIDTFYINEITDSVLEISTLFKIETKTQTERFYRGFKFDFFLNKKHIGEMESCGFFTEDSPQLIEKVKIKNIANNIRGCNILCRKKIQLSKT